MTGHSLTVADYGQLLRRRWPVVAAVPVVLTALLLIWSLSTPSSYAASAQVGVAAGYLRSASELEQATTVARNSVAAYANLVSQAQVLDKTIAKLGLATTADELRERVSATSSKEMALVEITATAPTAQGAVDLVDGLAASLVAVIEESGPRHATGQPALAARTVAAGRLPTSPESPRTGRNVASGLVAGTVLGLLLARRLDGSTFRRPRPPGRVPPSSTEALVAPEAASVPRTRQEARQRRSASPGPPPRGPHA